MIINRNVFDDINTPTSSINTMDINDIERSSIDGKILPNVLQYTVKMYPLWFSLGLSERGIEDGLFLGIFFRDVF